jgi:serine/threonine protein kinase
MAPHFQTISNYRLGEELAEGAFGQVYRAEHMYLTNRIAAIKFLHTLVSTEKERDHFRREAHRLELLKHPHILPIIDFGIQEGTPYWITEFASGGSLRDRLRQVDTQPISLDESLQILRQVAQALDNGSWIKLDTLLCFLGAFDLTLILKRSSEKLQYMLNVLYLFYHLNISIPLT